MEYLNLFPGIFHILMGATIALICLPLLRGKVGINPYYGFRFRRALESPTNWKAVNQYGAKKMIFWSLVLIAFGVLLLFLPVRPGTPLFWLALAAPLVVLVPAIQTYSFAKSLPRQDDQVRPP